MLACYYAKGENRDGLDQSQPCGLCAVSVISTDNYKIWEVQRRRGLCVCVCVCDTDINQAQTLSGLSTASQRLAALTGHHEEVVCLNWAKRCV